MFGSGCNGHELMGSRYVARGAYEVTRTLPNGREETITPHKWATAVKIGSELAMGIIFEQRVPIADRGKKICPRCHEDNSNSADDSVLWCVTLSLHVSGTHLILFNPSCKCSGRFCISEIPNNDCEYVFPCTFAALA